MLHLKLQPRPYSCTALVHSHSCLPSPGASAWPRALSVGRKTKSSLILIDEHKSFSVFQFQFFGLHCCNNQMIEHLRSGAESLSRGVAKRPKTQDEHGSNGRWQQERGGGEANSTQHAHTNSTAESVSVSVFLSLFAHSLSFCYALCLTPLPTPSLFPPHLCPNLLLYTILRYVHRCSRARLFVARNLFTVRIGSEFRLRHYVVSREMALPHTHTHTHRVATC